MANLFIIVFILSSIHLTYSLRFDLQSGSTKCVSEDIQTNTTSIGKYSVVSHNLDLPLPRLHHINVRVTSPHGSSLHNADNVAFGNFKFTASMSGDYMVCFWMAEKEPTVTGAVDLDWTTRAASNEDLDITNVTKKGRIYGITQEMELELRKMHDTVKNIHDEMFYLRERDLKMQDMNISTTAKMIWLSFLSLVVCLSVAGLQLYHLKTYFIRKKVL